MHWRARTYRRAAGQALDSVAVWPSGSQAAQVASGQSRSKNDCASSGEVVVYQPERTAVNPFGRYPYPTPNVFRKKYEFGIAVSRHPWRFSAKRVARVYIF